MERVAYLGPQGSYSELAAAKFRKDGKLIACPSYRAAVELLKKGDCDYAALPIENSLNGAVLANIDLLQSTQGVFACEHARVMLDHRLATLNGAKTDGISRIYSHEQPLAQCADYLYKNFPQAQLIAAPSTAASLNAVKSESDAAIVGAHVKRDGITLSPRNIADFPHNFTEFLLVRRGSADERTNTDKIFFSVTCRHKSGALLDILEPMRAGGLNMTKIQSRPIKGSSGEYRFFIEAEGDYADNSVRAVLNGIEKISLSLKLIGAYKSGD